MSAEQAIQYNKMKEIIFEGLFTIEPICKNLTKPYLKVLSTPGVAEVCQVIQEDLTKINELSIRGRSIAIVTRAKQSTNYHKYIMPIMDWIITQIKFYSNINSFPFIIRSSASLETVLTDLANSFCGVLFLDDEQLPEIFHPLNFFILKNKDVCKIKKCSLIDSEYASYILAHLINNNYTGSVSPELVQNYLYCGASRIHDTPVAQIGYENL